MRADWMIETFRDHFVATHEYGADGYFAGCSGFFGGGLGEGHESAVAV